MNEVAEVNILIFKTMNNFAPNYVIGNSYYYLYDTDTLNGENCPNMHRIPDKNEMMYTLDKDKNYVFIVLNGLNGILPSNIKSSDFESSDFELSKICIVLYSKTCFIRINEKISNYEKFKDMYEDVDANIDIYEEFFINMEKQIQSNTTITNNEIAITKMLNGFQSILDKFNDDLFLITKFSERFKIPKELAKFNLTLIKMAYSEYYIENKPFHLYVEHIYNHILKLVIEEYVYLSDNNNSNNNSNSNNNNNSNNNSNSNSNSNSNNNKVKHIADICYKEFSNLQTDFLKIGELCEFILYFIGRHKQLAKQTCSALFGAYFASVFKESPIHIAKKKQLVDLTNRAKLEQAKYNIKNVKTHESLKKFQMLKQLIDTVNEDITYIKELYKLQFFTIIHSFIEYPLIEIYFKRKINTENKDNLLYKLHTQLQNCTVQNYIQLFPSIMDTFTILTQKEKESGCSFIIDFIHVNKKLEDIEIIPKKGTIIENIINSLYDIENTDKVVYVEKNIALILYVAMYFYI
jgi:hypothetical protein